MSGGLTRGVELSLRTLALPWMLGMRWAGQLAGRSREGMPYATRSLGLAVKVALDEVFYASEVMSGALALRAAERRRLAREIATAHAFYERHGWIAEPAGYHRTPPPLLAVEERDARVGRLPYRRLSFESGWAPHAGEPGRGRWQGYAANRTAHAWVLRHAGAARPWVVCVPGFRMGQPAIDFAGFRAGWLHQTLGVNVAIAVLPFHGPRRAGRRSGDGYLTGDFVDTIHAQAQAVWDLRRLVGWLRREGAPAVGVYGVSLGGYTAALLAALDGDLERVVAGIPASCFVGLARSSVPAGLLPFAERAGFPFERIESLMRVVSPLALPPSVPTGRCFVYAGTADRLAPPEQAWDLWRHWGRPSITWYHGSHVSFLFEPSVRAMLREALCPEALLAAAAERTAKPKRSGRAPLTPRTHLLELRGHP